MHQHGLYAMPRGGNRRKHASHATTDNAEVGLYYISP